MKHKWILAITALIALVAGYSIGDYRARRFAYNNWAVFVTKRLEMELHWQENAAFYAYLDEPPAVAAWALETLINSYQRNAANVLSITGKPEMDSQSHEMFAHARLFKVYSSQNISDLAQLHLDRAISLSNGKDADELMQMVAWADEFEKKSGQQWAPPHGAQSALSGER